MSKKLPDITTKFADWYNDVVYKAELADLAPVRGCIVMRPYGYAIWENIQSVLDKKFKETGHKNAAFPLLIPESFLKQEAEHVEGFAPEVAVVTYAGGKELEEPLVVRPTSETIIHYMFARWIRSWRDLPMKVNQWCSVVRWEKRARPFLRTTEFWWQEGHTAHETYDEALEEALTMHGIYRNFIQDYLAIPVIAGKKTESEKFAGGDITFTFESMMQDGKALQMCTSHMISQNFAKAFGMKFQNREKGESFPYLTSWGLTSRQIGAIVMVHGDQKGLIMPPNIAPNQIVIVPIFRAESKDAVLGKAQELYDKLSENFRVILDDAENETPGAKFYRWELKGIPLRIEIGPRDLENNQVTVADRLGLEKQAYSLDTVHTIVQEKLDAVQKELFDRAHKKLLQNWHQADKLEEFGPTMQKDNGFYQAGWCGCPQCEAKTKEYQGTIRCMLEEKKHATCFACDKPSISDVIVAKAY